MHAYMLRKDENLQKTLAEPSKLKHTIVDKGKIKIPILIQKKAPSA